MVVNVTEATEILGRVSPPLAAALQRRPDLLNGVGDDETVSARVQAALIGAALRDLAGAGLEETTRSLSDSMDRIN